jgi:hypothetical protein
MGFWAFLAVLGLGAWLRLGYVRLTQGGWRKSRGSGDPLWFAKDAIAVLIWPYMLRWMAMHD